MKPERDLCRGRERPSDAAPDGAARSRFERRYQEHFARAVRYFLRSGFSRDQALEFTQDVFIRVLLHEERGGAPIRAFGPWLASVLRNKAVSEIRKTATRRRHGLDDEPAGEPAPRTPADMPGPEALMRASERTKEIARAVEELPEMMRTCLVLRYFHELSVEEASRFLGLSSNTVKSHLRRALKALRAELVDPELEAPP